MGSILSARCQCGYERDGLFSGGGRDPAPTFLPGSCRYCREVVSVRTSSRRLRCSRCGRKPTLYALYDPEGLDERFPDMPHACPRCQAVELRFEFEGVWD